MPNGKARLHLVITLAIATCLIGIFLRVYFYVINRSLWLDESMLALNIVNRSFLGLFKPLDLDQGAPIGFLVLEKTVARFLGDKDYILRLVPLLAGLVSLPLMYVVSRKYIGKLSALIPLGLFALSPRLIYFSSELKQYSIDVLVTLVLLLIALRCLEDNAKPRAFAVLGVAGFLTIWISHPSLFVFAGIFLTLSLGFAVRRTPRPLYWLTGIGIAWMISVGVAYWISLRHLESNSFLATFWNFAFAPLPPWSRPSWYKNAFIVMLRDQATLPISAITVGLFAVGILSLTFRRWQFMLLLLTPLLLALIASALGRYPFFGRLLLFLVPLLFLLLAEGWKRAGTVLQRVNRPMAWFVSASLAAYFLYGPIAVAYKNLKSPPMGGHIKPVMSYLSQNYLKTDVIYLYYGSTPSFEFYAPHYGLDGSRRVAGIQAKENPSMYLEDVNRLKGNGRVWFVFSNNCNRCKVDEKKFILEYLNVIGLRRLAFGSPGATVYLYDLGQIP